MTNKEVVLGFLKAADNHDIDTVLRLWGKNHMFYTSLSPVPMNTEQHLGMLQAFGSAFTGAHHEIHDVIESGNKVVVRGTWHGTHTADFNGIPASGNDVRLPFIAIVEVENEEMLNQWMELDGMTMMMQMGVVPAMG